MLAVSRSARGRAARASHDHTRSSRPTARMIVVRRAALLLAMAQHRQRVAAVDLRARPLGRGGSRGALSGGWHRTFLEQPLVTGVAGHDLRRVALGLFLGTWMAASLMMFGESIDGFSNPLGAGMLHPVPLAPLAHIPDAEVGRQIDDGLDSHPASFRS